MQPNSTIKNMKIGDTIECINTIGSESLEYKMEYIVTDINQYGNIQVREDFSPYATLAHYYKPTRFRLLSVNPAVAVKKKKEIDFSKTYLTSGGNKVNLLAMSQDPEYPVLGEVFVNGKWESEKWTLDGKFFLDGSCSDSNLVEASQCVECQDFNVHLFADGSVLIDGNDAPSITLSKQEMEKIVSIWNGYNV
jgi:hypothetical protein